jgi:hypothetical protein
LKIVIFQDGLIKFVQIDLDTWSEQVDASGKILKVTIENTTEDKLKYKLGGTLEMLFYVYSP